MAVVGLPILQQHGTELIDAYTRTRAAIKSQLPALENQSRDATEHIEKLVALKSKLEKAKKDYDAGKLSASEWASLSQSVTAEIAAINHSLSGVENSFSIISSAVNPTALQVE